MKIYMKVGYEGRIRVGRMNGTEVIILMLRATPFWGHAGQTSVDICIAESVKCAQTNTLQ